MPTTRIVIPTTEGVVEIQSLFEETDGVETIMTLDGGFVPAAISEQYRQFVLNPGGVIERETGHASYRLDVSAQINTGDSWQLAVYLAHRFLQNGNLAKFGETAQHTIIATGAVRRRGNDISIEPVQHIRQKLDHISKHFSSSDGADLTLVLPQSNADEITEEERAWLPSGMNLVALPSGPVGIERIRHLLQEATEAEADEGAEAEAATDHAAGDAREPVSMPQIELSAPVGDDVKLPSRTGLTSTKSLRTLGLGIAAILAAVLASTFYFEGKQPPDNPAIVTADQRAKSDVTAVKLEVSTLAQPQKCSALRFDRPKREVIKELHAIGPHSTLTVQEMGPLCGVTVVLKLRKDRDRASLLIYQLGALNADKSITSPAPGFVEAGPKGEELSFNLDIPAEYEKAEEVSIGWVETQDEEIQARVSQEGNLTKQELIELYQQLIASGNAVQRSMTLKFQR